ncbi:hypothetical protein ZOD2009_01850 [Haladaptatus paucihalophilus DX253]|uniref:Uncharacterized protein n=1 Tax=Haladaptatus paucihalophilus DX253 TaxID=797209 RepID=E7QN52_HALPU|nr:hypothetical protein [Haladaptatus paucihalophilus]EFW93847.1 hypothetical protein ZOD2009_01850 [Haladaptatus paucihalophilus DX253]SHL53045.1 hypothetical protein SAMN05444342_4066 [Haladaptatus paucihalophilus DX253]
MEQSPLSQASDDRLLDMLFAGEEIEEEIELEGARIAVTSHRLLAFMPEGGERRFDHEDRPNVLDARAQAAGKPDYLSWSVRSFVYGLLLVGCGYLLNSSGLLTNLDGTTPTEGGVILGLQQMVGMMVSAFTLLTSVLLPVGGVLLLAAAVFGALYVTTRSEELIIERAGRDPIRVPVNGDEAKDAARRIRAAVGTSSKPSAD